MSLHRPLKIFVPHCSDLLTDTRPHGDGLVAQGFIRSLAERGHELHVAFSEVDLAKPMPRNAHLYPIKTASSAPLTRRLEYAWLVRKLFHQLQQNTPFDVIHQLNPVYTGVSLALAGCRPPVVLGPYIGDWTQDRRHGRIRSLLGRVRGTIAAVQQRNADVVLLTTTAASSRLVGRSGSLTVEMLPHGIDSSFFCPPESNRGECQSIQTDAAEILFMSHISRRKGIFDLLQAFERIALRYPKARLVIAGGGPELEEAKCVAQALSASGAIRFLGFQDRSGAVRVLQNCDIYCQPSHGEPYGMTAVEAMSCGKPVVVTEAGGLGCLVDDDGGLRVPVQNPARLAEALCSLIADPERRRTMGEHNRRRVVESMAWNRVVERLEGIYVSAIQAKNTAGLSAAPGPHELAFSVNASFQPEGEHGPTS